MKFIQTFRYKFFFRKTRHYCRRYEQLMSSGQNRFVINMTRELSLLDFDKNERIPKWALGDLAYKNINLSIKQYILRRIDIRTLNISLMLASDEDNPVPITMGLPPHWIRHLKSKGLPLNNLRCTLSWQCKSMLILGYGILRTLKISFFQYSQTKDQRILNNISKGFDLFVNLTNNNIPSISAINGQTIIDWFLTKYSPKRNVMIDFNGKVEMYKHDALIFSLGSYFFPLKGIKSRVKFFFWSLLSGFVALVYLIRGRWAFAFMHDELVLNYHYSFLEQSCRPDQVYFHNSGWFNRPLWTYTHEKNNGKICLYFYSTNNFQFLEPDQTRATYFGWELMNWPHYIVWNNNQKNMIEALALKPNTFDVVGHIWFLDNQTENQSLDKIDVAVFDVNAIRPAYYQSLGAPVELYTPSKMTHFIKSISKICCAHNLTLGLKQKREPSYVNSKYYLNEIKKLSNQNKLIEIDFNQSAVEIIKNSRFVICSPFTSPAIIAKQMGKGVVYYDPSGTIQPNDIGRSEITVISSPEELESHIIKSLKR